MPRPMTPAPTTIVFGRCDETTIGALMTDSLHRACPARFSGSDLSRPHRAAPQPRANFKPSPRAMQEFSVPATGSPRRRAIIGFLRREESILLPLGIRHKAPALLSNP